MNASNAKRLVLALRKMAAAWPRTEFSETTIVVYAEALADLPVERVEAAIATLVRTSEWLPTVAKIRAEAAVSHRTFAEAEWLLVQAEVRRVGIDVGGREFIAGGKRYRTVGATFVSPITAEAVATIGWRAICEADPASTAMRETFVRTWSKIAEARRDENDRAIGPGGMMMERGA